MPRQCALVTRIVCRLRRTAHHRVLPLCMSLSFVCSKYPLTFPHYPLKTQNQTIHSSCRRDKRPWSVLLAQKHEISTYPEAGFTSRLDKPAHHRNHFSPVINHRFRICAKPQQQQQLKNKVGTDIQPATITSPVKFKHRLGRIEGSVSNNKWSSTVTEILHKSVTITTS